MMKRHTCGVALLAALPLSAAATQPLALAPLNDAELGSVAAGLLSFDFSDFSVSGDARFTYYTPGDTASTWIGNIALSRSNPTVPFADPYNLDILTRPGLADYFNLAFPANADGAAKWQFTYDWGVNADGVDFQGGAWVYKDVVYYGGSLQISTPTDSDGVAFGLALYQHIGDLLLRPRGRADTADAESAAEQLHVRGMRTSAARLEADGTTTTPLAEPWQIAHITYQPGIFNATTNASGEPRLHLGIGWPTDPVNHPAPWGTVSIDNLSFKSDVSPSLDLGASRIGGIQIQYLDIMFRP